MYQRWRVVMSIILAVMGCRYRYDLLPSPGEAAAGAKGEAAAANSGGSAEPGGTTTGGAPDLPPGTDNAGVPSTNEGGAQTSGIQNGGTRSGDTPSGGTQSGSGGSSTAGTTGSAGNGGASGSGNPPDVALCKMGSYSGHNYLLCSEQRSWIDAKGGCVAIGMRLVRVDDAGENQWLFDNAYTPGGNNSYVWLGGTDQAQEGEWHWTDGDLFWVGGENGLPQNGLFTGWHSREPNNVNNAENCASLEISRRPQAGTTPAASSRSRTFVNPCELSGALRRWGNHRQWQNKTCDQHWRSQSADRHDSHQVLEW